ncbi:hypothetical protein [Pedobacter sp. JY14-1]|uniref:hypothetical protein n=1 Tax=Pedobacter sp. JY14-1 TaxID=3034151 RepID=UPI0023E341D5|nr:hypothetical protein [Pedobacter sp. JY14-1]
MQYMESITISIAFFVTVAVVVIAVLNFILKNRLISSGQTDPELLKMLSNSFDHQLASLKWGVVLAFAGLGLVVINYIPDARTLESPLPYGIELLFLAIGFQVYYLLAMKSKKP